MLPNAMAKYAKRVKAVWDAAEETAGNNVDVSDIDKKVKELE